MMMRTLRDMNMSKFVAEDVPLFLSLIQDLFPVQKTDRNSFPEVSVALEKVISLIILILCHLLYSWQRKGLSTVKPTTIEAYRIEI